PNNTGQHPEPRTANRPSPPRSWTCPDTLLYSISEMTPSVPGRPWQAPALSGHDTGAAGKVHPGLVISMATRSLAGSDTSEKEFLEPNFPWVGDLNGDDLVDFILRDGIGSPKETVVLVNCGGEGYWPVFHGMADEIRVEYAPDSEGSWKRLRFHYWPAGSEEGKVILKRWDGKTYATCCESQVTPGARSQ